MRATGADRHWRHPGWERKVRNPLLLTSPGAAMLAKRTSKNQLTLPKAIVQAVGEADARLLQVLVDQLGQLPRAGSYLPGSDDPALGADVQLRHHTVRPFGIADDGPVLIEEV